MAKLNPWKMVGYKAGQSISCKVIAPEPGGYRVVADRDDLPGFLPTDEKLSAGDMVLAQFVCLHENRILLSPRLTTSSGKADSVKAAPGSVNWAEHLEADDPAFNTWAREGHRRFVFKRATDLLVAPLDPSSVSRFKMSDRDPEWLIIDLEGGMRTGCVRITSDKLRSRAAMILWRGRVVGCIYRSTTCKEASPTDVSLGLSLKDLEDPDTEVLMYALPEEIVVPLSALFFGYPVRSEGDSDARRATDYLLNWFEQKKRTGCIILDFPATASNAIILVHKGKFAGAFYVDEQKLVREKEFVYGLLDSDPSAKVETSVLPEEMISSAVRYGYSLGMVWKKGEY